MRGWLNNEKIYTREATPQEEAEAARETRQLAFRYKTWEELVEDEAKYGIDANMLINNNALAADAETAPRC